MNLIMFIFMDIIPVVAFVYVLLFNGGQTRMPFALSMIGCSLLIKLFEKVLGQIRQHTSIFPFCPSWAPRPSLSAHLPYSVRWWRPIF